MKKSKDSYDIFSVFKPGSFMEDASFSEKFKYWFKNVYWYHFRLPTFAVIIVSILAVWLVYDVTNREYNDLDYILAGAVFADTEQMDEFSEYLGSFIDVSTDDEDGKAVAKVGEQMLCTQRSANDIDSKLQLDEYNAASIEKIQITMADDEILLFFFDKIYAEYYASEGAFEPLSSFGIESDNEYYVRVDDLPIIKEIGIKHNDGIYAGIKVKIGSRTEKERLIKKYENAAAALSGLLADQ